MSKNLQHIQRITNKVYVSPNAVFEFGTGGGYIDAGIGAKRGFGANGSHVFWGEKDNELYDMHGLCCKNPTKWRLIATRRDFVFGKGIRIKFEDVVDGKIILKDIKDSVSDEIKAFFKKTEFQELVKDAIMQMEFSGRYFIKLSLDINARVADLQLIDVFHCRPRKMTAGERSISAYIINPNFGTSRYRKIDDVVLPAFNPKNPTEYAVSIIDIREKIPGIFYNAFALWWGTKGWTKVANKIPPYHENGLDNGYNIKYHVSIPDNYFEDDDLSKAEQEELKKTVCSVIDETLKGKTDSVLFTFHSVDVNGKEITGVKVTPLKNEMSDTAYTAIFNMANTTQSAAHGISPVLAGIDTGSKLGGSGKEMEVAANYTQNVLTTSSRMLIVKLFEYLRLIEGWDESYVMEFENIEMYNPDVTPTSSSSNPSNNGTPN